MSTDTVANCMRLHVKDYMSHLTWSRLIFEAYLEHLTGNLDIMKVSTAH